MRNEKHQSRIELLEQRQLLSSTSWFNLARLEDRGTSDGGNVAVSGDTIVVGTRLDDRRAENAGVAHVYTRDDQGTTNDPADDQWDLVQELLPDDVQAHHWFGQDVAIDGDTLVVTASHRGGLDEARQVDAGPGDELGATYVYTRNNEGAVDTYTEAGTISRRKNG